MWCLPLSLLTKNSTLSRDTTCAYKTLKPYIVWESTIPIYGLSKILQVSWHRCNKAIKIASKSVRSFSVRKIGRCTNLWWRRIKATDCIIKVAIIRGNIKWRYLALRGWAYKQKAHGNLCFPLRMAYLLLLCIYFHAWVKVFLSIPFYFSLLPSIMWWGKI